MDEKKPHGVVHRLPAEPVRGVTYLSGDLTIAVATARVAADGTNPETLGADLASQCLRDGLVDEVLVDPRRCCSATAYASRPAASA